MRILIMGDYGTGKTTFANELAQKYGLQVMSFAKPIRLNLSIMLNCNIGLLENKAYPWVRPLLRSYGQAMKDLHGKNYWAEQAANMLTSSNFVFDDLRFEAEYKYIKSLFPDIKTVCLGEPIGYELDLLPIDLCFEKHSDYLTQFINYVN